MENYEFVHIQRELNAEADMLANNAKDYSKYYLNLKI